MFFLQQQQKCRLAEMRRVPRWKPGMGKTNVKGHDQSEASNRRWLAWLLKSKFLSPRDEEHGVARFTVLEIWLSFYVMPSLERCCEILLRIKKMNLLLAVKVSVC
jgi:hypothetical protein